MSDDLEIRELHFLRVCYRNLLTCCPILFTSCLLNHSFWFLWWDHFTDTYNINDHEELEMRPTCVWKRTSIYHWNQYLYILFIYRGQLY